MADDVDQARALVAASRVTVGGAPAERPGRLVAPDEPVQVRPPPPRFVSRGGEKLEAALAVFGTPVDGRLWLDAGSSTGGFTDCLLRRGASGVVAVDVGRGQLHQRLRDDPRVEVHERTHLRDVADVLGPRTVDGAVADLSFIGLASVLAPLMAAVNAGGPLVVLVKPQFEARRVEVDRGGGVIGDPEVWRRVLGEVIDACVEQGASMMGVMASPLRGADGNVEFFLDLRTPGASVVPSAAHAGSCRHPDRSGSSGAVARAVDHAVEVAMADRGPS